MKVINELPVESHLIEQFAAVADEGRQMIEKKNCNNTDELITAINEYLCKPAKKKWFKKVDNWTEKSLPLGTLWAECLQKEFGWEWVNITFEDDSQAVGMFSKDRSIGFYPWYFIFGCVENDADVTVLLAWNMLKEGRIPTFEPKAYENLMEGVHHIVPYR